jgi:hypothetical protein
MSWTTPTLARLWEPVTCCYCGRRAPRDLRVLVSAGWQGRAEYPVRYRCPRCRRRQEGEAAGNVSSGPASRAVGKSG